MLILFKSYFSSQSKKIRFFNLESTINNFNFSILLQTLTHLFLDKLLHYLTLNGRKRNKHLINYDLYNLPFNFLFLDKDDETFFNFIYKTLKKNFFFLCQKKIYIIRRQTLLDNLQYQTKKFEIFHFRFKIVFWKSNPQNQQQQMQRFF